MVHHGSFNIIPVCTCLFSYALNRESRVQFSNHDRP